MKFILFDRSALKWAVALLVAGANCLSAAEGPMGKPFAEAFPASAWNNRNRIPPKFPFQQSVKIARQGVELTVNILNNQVVNLEIQPGEQIPREKIRSRQDAWIEALFPGIPQENIKFHEPDTKKPGEQVISCKYGDRSYLVIFGLMSQSINPTGYQIRVGDAEYFTTPQDVVDGNIGADPGKKVIPSIFQTKLPAADSDDSSQ